VSLWAIFSTTLDHCAAWFQRRLAIAALAGAFAGALSYYTGTRLSDYSLGEPLWNSLLLLAMVWAVVFVVCMLLARYFGSSHSSQ